MKCKLESCENEVEQTGVGAPRKFCSDAHRVEYWNAHLRPPAQIRHSITNVDEAARTGDCKKCARRVKVFRVEDAYQDGRPRLRWVCSNRVAESPSRERYRKSQKAKDAKARSTYGITQERLNDLRAVDACEACGLRDIRLFIDHCHDTLLVRGMLCQECNTGLGKLRHDPIILRSAIDYLERASRRA